MKSTVFFLLASLLLPPALSEEEAPEDYWTFRYYHTYFYNDPFFCTEHLRKRHRYMTKCLSPMSIILGDTVDQTSMDDLLKICRGEGTDMGNNLFKSNAMFRVVKCRLKDPNAVTSNCVWRPTFESAQIIVGCKRGYPVHFEDIA